jgi:hypothetical protein
MFTTLSSTRLFEKESGMHMKLSRKGKIFLSAMIPLIVTCLIVVARCSKTQIGPPGPPEVLVVQVEQKPITGD